MGKFYIKRNDTASSFEVQLVDADGTPVNLTGATVQFLMSRGSTSTVAAAAVIVDAATGTVRYDWQTGDTGTSGTYRAEWEVTDSTNHVQTFPNPGYDEVVISPDLG